MFSHGATGGGLEDTLDPHFPVTNPDIARCNNLYEPLLFWDEDYTLQPALATSVTPNKDATEWVVELREDVIFHNGKPMTADDVLFTLARVTDPKNTAPGGTELLKILDLKSATKRRPVHDQAAAEVAVHRARPAARRVHRGHHPERLRHR